MSGGSVTSPRVECRKFVPNIFNKSKCSSCFKQKEEHSAEALESNRATRKISKCGYLFVAPGWDFSNPLNRTKRWQRRWFVLYDDGELTYSVDEHPETVPQSRIDMTRVQEVAAAEDVTGHPYSLAITTPEGVTFIKGTCREETRWWADVLQVYSRNKGRHKRNATFPGGQTTILQASPTIRSNTPNPSRPRLNSCRSEPRSSSTWNTEKNQENSSSNYNCPKPDAIIHVNGNTSITCIENGNSCTNGSTYNYGSPSTTTSVTVNGSVVQSLNTEKPPIAPSNEARSYRDQPASSASPPTRDKLRAEDKARRRMSQQTERSLTIVSVDANDKIDDDASRRILLEHEREREGKLRDIAASLTQPRVRRNIKARTSEPTRDVVDAVNQAHQDKLIRGDPDGCGLDLSGIRYSPTSELRVDLPAEDLLNIKKGWLMKQGLNKEWSKHWFVLRGFGLMYYRDPTTEDKGIMDGVIDLNTVTAVTPIQVARNYGFQTVTWDDRGTIVFSAVTAGIRSSWMSAIRRAANLPEPDSQMVCQDTQQDGKPQSPTVSINDRERETVVSTTPLTPRSVLFSSDEEYRTASEGGRRESDDWSEMPVTPPLTRNGDWPFKASNWSHNTNHEWSELPPSPPLTRTALSRVKARSRSSSRSRVYKRSRSSPPSSRRSTLDSVRSEDLMMACCELGEDEETPTNCLPTTNDNPLIVELLESQVTLLRDQLDQNQHPSSLLAIVERQENEIENLKSQLNTAKIDVTNSEKELANLRQQKAEAVIRDKQIEELLSTVQRTEKLRKKDVEDLDKLKKIFSREKESLECKLLETESILRETTERCEILTNELSSSHRTVEHLQDEISSLSNKLSQGIEENERLYSRIREMEGKGSLSVSRERGRSFDSLSDLTNIDLDLDLSGFDKERIMEEFDELRGRFEKAVLEIRAMRKELREAHTTQDALELELFAYKQDNARAGENNQAQGQLMAARIQDLTNKLGASEKQMRLLKQKITKGETRDKRRSLSLKGKESFSISQEVEEKLLDLENKILSIEQGKKLSKESTPIVKKERSKKEQKMIDKRLRRKSLDSATSSEPMKVLIRLSTLEAKVATVSESVPSDAEKDSSECSELSTSSTSEVSLEVILRLKKLERAISKSKRRLEKCFGSTQAEEKAEKCLRDVNDILDSCNDYKKTQTNSQLSESIGIIVSRLENLLEDKIMELTCRRRQLEDSGDLDDHAKLRLMAEKLAYEFIIMRQLKSSISSRTNDRSMILGELVETSQLISNFKSKIYGTKPKTYQNTSYIQYLTRVLANKLVLVGGKTQNATEEVENNAARLEMKNFLLKKQKDVIELMEKYKETKLRELADALATETLNLSDQDPDLGKHVVVNSTKKLLEDHRIREAWAMAQETVNKELVQAEVSHVILRCGQMYEQNISSITDTCLTFEVSEQVSLEAWSDETQSRLRKEMESSVQELTEAYEESLERMKKTKPIVKYDSRQLLTDYADVIAQKALIDARIAVLGSATQNSKPQFTGETYVSSLIKHEDLLLSLVDEENWTENPIFDAEYVYLFQQFSRECEDKIAGKKDKNLKTMRQLLIGLEENLLELGRSLQYRINEEKNLIKFNPQDWTSIYEKCNDLGENIKKLSKHAKAMNCKQCNVLQESMANMSIQHAKEIKSLKRNQEKDLLEIKGELDIQRNSLTTQYEHEASSLRERARKLEYRLNTMDSEHSAHVNELRSAYQRSISADLDTDTETRKRYKEEIKQLRALCEKGLIAMENSHRRIIAEMEEKHRQELENLRIDKEQALSEETQATLAALDAMRKAHENEVQKEIAKFKQEFLKQMQARENIGIFHKDHDVIFREEMEEIKQEILSLSSKYSSKCVESAALEEKVGLLTKQISQAQHHIMQLDAKNKQLRAHLVIETSEPGISESSQLLGRGRENEIAEQREEIVRLQQQLKVAQHRCDSTTLAGGRRTIKTKTNNSTRRACPVQPHVTHPASPRNPQLSPLQR